MAPSTLLSGTSTACHAYSRRVNCQPHRASAQANPARHQLIRAPSLSLLSAGANPAAAGRVRHTTQAAGDSSSGSSSFAVDDIDWSSLGFGDGSVDANAFEDGGSSAAALPAAGCWQQPLSSAERKAKRAEAQRMGRDIVTVNMGKNGISQNFIAGLAGALAANELVKVRLSSNCLLEVDEAREEVTQATDSVCVHAIGSTIILYRDKTLPRLESTLVIEARAESADDELPDEDDSVAESDISEGAAAKTRRRPTQSNHAGRPTEFKVL